MSPQRQAELAELLDDVFKLGPLRQLGNHSLLQKIQYFLLEAGEKVFQTNNQLIEQLRKYLDDQAWLENKRIIEMIQTIERQAIGLKDDIPKNRDFAEVDQLRPHIELILSRSLFSVPHATLLEDIDLHEGDADLEMEVLFQQSYIDEAELASNIRALLQRRKQITLSEVIEHHPIRKGLAEVVGYINLAARDDKALIDDTQAESVQIDTQGKHRKQLHLPRIIFTR